MTNLPIRTSEDNTTNPRTPPVETQKCPSCEDEMILDTRLRQFVCPGCLYSLPQNDPLP